MGRRDGVQVVLEVVARVRQILPAVVVSYEPGWERRGNGTSANYEGGLVHHTASPSSLARPFPTQTVLRDGRKDLPGPLCNFAGPACTVQVPRLHVMSANPANHAGASGGRSMGPLPRTSLFNPRVLGLEIDYAGTTAMLPGQLLVALAWARAVADVVGGGDLERVRAHFETSITGKWDIGAGGSRSADMQAFRRDARTITAPLEDSMATLDNDDLNAIAARVWSWESTSFAGRATKAGSTPNVIDDAVGVVNGNVLKVLDRLDVPQPAQQPVTVDAAAVATAMLADAGFADVIADRVADRLAQRLQG